MELQEDRSTRKSRAKFNFDQTVLPAVIRLMRHGWCDIDVLLDPIFTPFPRTRHRTKWYPTGTVDTLADGSPDPDSLYRALQRVDRAEPWRLYFRNAPADPLPAVWIASRTSSFRSSSEDEVRHSLGMLLAGLS
ncbi:unnamed protein product [Phytophthora fragariaefolia]|uniref:Unnamed protein product n=1 Tax=Phytophthora fragariaefolia TaxID=1490495 RepID=A0A9W6XB29_9STRA|nr:unnamed protein product [Phytophthora fragariaefolia]